MNSLPDSSVPAIGELDRLGLRFVCWRWEDRHGKATKPPIQVGGGYADSSNPLTWSTLAETVAAAKNKRLDGIGFVLDHARDDIADIDLDGCRNSATGEIAAWANKIIRAINSYTEISPSGCGVKILCRVKQMPELLTHKRVIRKATNGSTKDEAVEIYTTRRYFCLTGQVLPDVPDEIMDATAPFARLAAWLAKGAAKRVELPEAFTALLARDAKLREAWTAGAKLGKGGDVSASGHDLSLALYLSRHLADADLLAVLRAHPHGQIGSGKLKGKAAERRLAQLTELVRAARSEPQRANGEDAASDWRREVVRLATLPAIEADREMEAGAKAIGCLVSTLRDEVRRARGEATEAGDAAGRALGLGAFEPWPESVEGAELLTELAATFDQYLALPEHGGTKAALWTVHTHALEASFITPRLAITSAVKGCGKTTLLDLLSGLTPKSLQAANITAAATFRTIEAQRPTLLVDEADTFLAENEELRGVLNSGHTRSGSVIRVVEHNGELEPRQFSTWAAVAIAKIGKLPGTLEDRSVKVEMPRALPGEVKARLRRDRLDQFHPLARRCARWASDNLTVLANADPPMPASVANRLADNWRPLLAIADCAGGEWPQRARAALAAEAATANDSALAVALLQDLRELFIPPDTEEPAEKLATTWLVAELVKMEARPWAELGRSRKPLTPHRLAALLVPFGVAPQHGRHGNVYLAADFADVWQRYLPSRVSAPGEGLEPSPPPDPPSPGSQIFTSSQTPDFNDLDEHQTFTTGEGREGLEEAKPLKSGAREDVKICDPGEKELGESVPSSSTPGRPDTGTAAASRPPPGGAKPAKGEDGYRCANTLDMFEPAPGDRPNGAGSAEPAPPAPSGTKPKFRKPKKGEYPHPRDVNGWRAMVRDHLEHAKAHLIPNLIRQWVVEAGGELDGYHRVRVPDGLPLEVAQALGWAIEHYKIEIAPEPPLP